MEHFLLGTNLIIFRVCVFEKITAKLQKHCVFCENNGESQDVYTSHAFRAANGRVECPILRRYKCPRCGASGDTAHTIRYCDRKPILTMEDVTRKAEFTAKLKAHRSYHTRLRM